MLWECEQDGIPACVATDEDHRLPALLRPLLACQHRIRPEAGHSHERVRCNPMTTERAEGSEVKALPMDPALLESKKQIAAMARTAWLAGAGAAVLAAGLAFGAFWLIQDPYALQAQMAEFEAQISARSAEEEARINAIGERIAALESLRAGYDGIRVELEELRVLTGRRPEAVPELLAEVEKLNERLDRAALEGERLAAEIQALSAMEASLATGLEANRAASRSVEERLTSLESKTGRSPETLLAVLWIARSAEGSEPFPEQFRALRVVSPEQPTAALAAAAASGVPSRRELLGALPSAARAAARATAREVTVSEGDSEPAGSLDALSTWVRGLVSVERIDGATDDAPLAELIRGGANDLGVALGLIHELPEGIRSGLAAWSADAERRIQLDAEINRLFDLAIGSLH